MYHFEYVPKKEISKKKKEVIELIKFAQDKVRESFTFQFDFIGSSKRNMVIYDIKRNIGFDFDIDIEINNDKEKYTPEEIKQKLMDAFNKAVAEKYYCGYYNLNFSNCENNTRVFTIKVKDHEKSRIVYSCDFAIVNNYGKGQEEYIRFNKSNNIYTWEKQSKGFYRLPEKIKFCKDNGLWNEVRKIYLNKKNHNTNKDKKSRSIFAETINQVYNKIHSSNEKYQFKIV